MMYSSADFKALKILLMSNVFHQNWLNSRQPAILKSYNCDLHTIILQFHEALWAERKKIPQKFTYWIFNFNAIILYYVITPTILSITTFIN